jgi:mannose-6-phosphate isomerase-like protein (cupin superfamily)
VKIKSVIKINYLTEYDTILSSKQKTTKIYKDYSKSIINKPWGNEFLIYQNKKISLWLLNLNGKSSTSLHCHKHKNTTLIPINNRVRVNLIEKLFYAKKKEIVFLPKRKFHQSYNFNNSILNLLEIETPNIKDDIIRHHDYYGRVENNFSIENKINKYKENKSLVIFNSKKKRKYFLNKKILIERFFPNQKINLNKKLFNNYIHFYILNGGLLDINKIIDIDNFTFYQTNRLKELKLICKKETDILFI